MELPLVGYPIPSLYRLAFLQYVEGSPPHLPTLPYPIQHDVRIWNLLEEHERDTLRIRWEMTSTFSSRFSYRVLRLSIKEGSMRMLIWLVRKYSLSTPLGSPLISPVLRGNILSEIDNRAAGHPGNGSCLEYCALPLANRALRHRRMDCLRFLIPFVPKNSLLTIYHRALLSGLEDEAQLVETPGMWEFDPFPDSLRSFNTRCKVVVKGGCK